MIYGISQWLGRKAILYVLLVFAIAACTFAVPWIKQVAIERTSTRTRAYVLENAAGRIASERDKAAALFSAKASELRHETTDKLKERQRGLRNERAVLAESIRAARPAWMLAIADQKMLLANERTKLRIAVIDQELAVVSVALDAAASEDAFIVAKTSLERQRSHVRRLVPLCSQANRNLAGFQQQWRWKVRQWLESDEHQSLVRVRNQRCDAARAAVARRDQLSRLARQKDDLNRYAQQAFARAAAGTGLIRKAGIDLAEDAERAQIELSGSLPERLRAWSDRWKLESLLQSAAVALALIIATPFLIRLLCYFLLAPLAMRRSAIRLSVPYEGASAIEPAGPSTTSVSVRLTRDEELLVRQDYLQTTSHSGAKGTQWWLDWKKPITSIATGMTFLTRIRGDGEVTTVSAVRDGLAEVTILALPHGSACVLQPRALAAIAQPIRRPLRITRHWRLTSLNAWLTLQLRYLVFHGPARLVLKGGRGVRVEAAEQGRVFGQDQLLGFSADLAYSVTRTETFWPYFLGREQLLKDRVMAGQGVLIIEEAPLTARRGGVRRGMEGLIDAGMKVFGM